MNANEEKRMKELLQQALPPVQDADPNRDLWPSILRRVNAQAIAAPTFGWAWFDWALAGGLVVFAALAPSTIPVILYYL